MWAKVQLLLGNRNKTVQICRKISYGGGVEQTSARIKSIKKIYITPQFE